MTDVLLVLVLVAFFRFIKQVLQSEPSTGSGPETGIFWEFLLSFPPVDLGGFWFWDLDLSFKESEPVPPGSSSADELLGFSEL